MDRVDVGVKQPAAIKLPQKGGDAAGAVHVLHVERLVPSHVRGHLGQARHQARLRVDVLEVVLQPCFLRRREQVQNGVGGAAHGDVQGHGVVECLEAGDGTRQHGFVVVLVVALGDRDGGGAGALVQLLAGGVRGEQRAVARQGQADGFGEAVHRVGGEHA